MRKFILPLLFIPAIAFAFDFVTTDLIADNAVTNAKIADNAITDDLVSDNSITPIKLASDNTPTDEYCFTYEGDTGNGQWQTCGSGGGNPFDQTLNTTDAVTFLSLETTQGATFASSINGGILVDGGTGNITMPVDGNSDTPSLIFDQASIASDGGVFFLKQENQYQYIDNDSFDFQVDAWTMSIQDSLIQIPANTQIYTDGAGDSYFGSLSTANTLDFRGYADGIYFEQDTQIIFDGNGGGSDTYFIYDSNNSEFRLFTDANQSLTFAASLITIGNDALIDGNLEINDDFVMQSDKIFRLNGVGGDTTLLYSSGQSQVELSVEGSLVLDANNVEINLTTNQVHLESGLSYNYQESPAGSETINTNVVVVLKTGITGGGDTLTLPDCIAGNDGQLITVKDASLSAGTDPITIDGDGADLIDGVGSISISIDGGKASVICNAGTGNWFVI